MMTGGGKSGKVANFRAIKSAVTLKLDVWTFFPPHSSHFRAIKSAVTLKQEEGRAIGEAEIFPRHQKRGHIEAQ